MSVCDDRPPSCLEHGQMDMENLIGGKGWRWQMVYTDRISILNTDKRGNAVCSSSIG